MKKFIQENWFKLSLTLMLALGGTSFFVLQSINDKKLDKCLELASRTEIENLPRNSIGFDREDYFNNCYKRYK